MKLNDLYIRDFGIFSNQKLNNLNSKLVVIGGKNRAGKSSFLDLLKYLPFSLPQDNSIPPAENKYYIEAEAEKDKQNYKLVLNGFAETEAVDKEGNILAAANLYNNLDQITYQQLFTISLDRLQKISKIGKNKKEEKRIYSILLGAGLKELIKLPEIAETYDKKANDIGGSLGNPAVASFKALNKNIKEAEEKRDQALKEVDYFINKKEKLKLKKKKLSKIESKTENLKRQIFILDLLKNNYQKLTKINELEFEVKEKQSKSKTRYKADQFKQFKKFQKKLNSKKEAVNKEKEKLLLEVKANKFNSFLKLITNNQDEILSFNNQKEILKEKLKNLEQKKIEISSSLRDLKIEIEDLNISWEKPLEKLDKIEIDLIKQQQLIFEIKEYQELSSKIKKHQKKIESFKLEIKNCENKISDYESLLAKNYFKPAFVSILAAAFLSSYFYYNSLYSLLIISAPALITALIYYYSNYKSTKLKEDNVLKLEQNIKDLRAKITFQKKLIAEKESSLTEKAQSLESYAQILTIKNQDYLKILAEYYREIKEKKRRYKKIKLQQKNFKNKKNTLAEKLKIISRLIEKIKPLLKYDFFHKEVSEKSVIKNQAEIFKDFDLIYADYLKAKKYLELKDELQKLKFDIKNALNIKESNQNITENLKKAISNLESAEKLKNLKEKLKSEKEQLNYNLNFSDKTKKYLSSFKQDEFLNNNSIEFNLKKANLEKDNFDKNISSKASKIQNGSQSKAEDLAKKFKILYSNFSSPESVEKKLKECESKLTDLVKNIEDLKKEITTLDNSIQKLSTSRKIEQAQQEIFKNRNDLEKLAQKYAVNKSVYFILNKLRSRMIKKAEDELLKPAADIFAQITNNEYQKIEPAAELESVEFITTNKNGRAFKNVDSLSRATLEQLFLALRFSRIKEIKAALPLILDDSFVNFDYQHLKNTLKIITTLAQKNQIFILSCHSHLVNAVSQITDSAQYWKLEKGNFTLSNSEKLAAYLKN